MKTKPEAQGWYLLALEEGQDAYTQSFILRQIQLVRYLYIKGATKVKADPDETYILYVGMPTEDHKATSIMVQITNAHPERVINLDDEDDHIVMVILQVPKYVKWATLHAG